MKKSPPCSASRKLRERERPGRPERVVEVLVLGLERRHEHEQHGAERQRRRDERARRAAAGARRRRARPGLSAAALTPPPRLARGPAAHPEEQGDEHAHHAQQHRRDSRGLAGQRLHLARVVDVDLERRRGVARPALRERPDVGERERQHRRRGDHDVELDRAAQLGQDHVPEPLPPARAVDARGLERRLVQAHQAGQEEHDAEADLAPDDHDQHGHQRVVLAADPVDRERLQADLREQVVDDAVQREHVARDDADDRHGEDVGHEEHAAVDAPAAHLVVQQHRHEHGDREQHRHRQQQRRAVARGVAEGRVVDRVAVVVEPDEGPARAADEARREVDDLDDRVAEDERQQRHQRRAVEVRHPRPHLHHRRHPVRGSSSAVTRVFRSLPQVV